MKRWVVIILLGALLTTTVAFGSIDDKLANHWASGQIDRDFTGYYFPYLARNYFEKFNPGGPISEQDFNLSLNSLLKDFEFEVSGIGAVYNLSRADMVNILGDKLTQIGLSGDTNLNIPFTDINTLTHNSIELLRLLYNHGIIKGNSNTTFGPEKGLSQVEAIIILQRVRGVLEEMNTIAFKTLGVIQTYNNQEEIIVTRQDDNKIIVTITKVFPTPGYSMSIKRILKSGTDYRICFNITPPKPDSIQLQVLTYKTLTLEIEREELGNSPYNFILDGYNKIPIKETM